MENALQSELSTLGQVYQTSLPPHLFYTLLFAFSFRWYNSKPSRSYSLSLGIVHVNELVCFSRVSLAMGSPVENLERWRENYFFLLLHSSSDSSNA